jgi:uncharacterized protein (DUF4213/DUF364 family)
MSALEDSLNDLKVREVYFPSMDSNVKKQRFTNFGFVQLNDETVGIMFIGLSGEVKESLQKHDTTLLEGKKAFTLANDIDSRDLVRKTIAFGAMNAICQSFFQRIEFPLDMTTDSLGLLSLQDGDIVGMVGLFPPLLKKIKKMNIPLYIIEKKEHLVQKNEKWEVSLDPRLLTRCNKVLCTSTTVLNESINDILSYCQNAEKISIIGPTAGFLPDPLFSRGVDVVGGTVVSQPSLFTERFYNNKRWGNSTEKYCIQSINYPGFESLISHL